MPITSNRAGVHRLNKVQNLAGISSIAAALIRTCRRPYGNTRAWGYGSNQQRWFRALGTVLLANFLAIPTVFGDRLTLPGIKGPDDRQSVEAVSYPWSAIGRVNKSTGGFCTGSVIAGTIVLTAAHCVWNKRTRNWLPPESLHFVAGYNRGAYLVHSGVTAIRVAASRRPDGAKSAPEDDWALLTLKRDILQTTGRLALAAADGSDEPDEQVSQSTVLQAGYSQDRAHILTRHSGCRVHHYLRQKRLILHDCDATKGDSGSPILVFRGEKPAILGIHVATGRARGRDWGIALHVSAFADQVTVGQD